MPLAILPVLILLLPILEIAGFIYAGQLIGLWQTIGLVILSAFVGVMVLRFAGAASIRRINRDLRSGQAFPGGIADGLFIAISGLLLIIPGFLTDIIALVLLFPPTRALLRAGLKRHVTVKTSFSSSDFRSERRPGRNDDFVDLSPEDFSRRPENGTTPRLPRQE